MNSVNDMVRDKTQILSLIVCFQTSILQGDDRRKENRLRGIKRVKFNLLNICSRWIVNNQRHITKHFQINKINKALFLNNLKMS